MHIDMSSNSSLPLVSKYASPTIMSKNISAEYPNGVSWFHGKLNENYSFELCYESKSMILMSVKNRGLNRAASKQHEILDWEFRLERSQKETNSSTFSIFWPKLTLANWKNVPKILGEPQEGVMGPLRPLCQNQWPQKPIIRNCIRIEVGSEHRKTWPDWVFSQRGAIFDRQCFTLHGFYFNSPKLMRMIQIFGHKVPIEPIAY